MVNQEDFLVGRFTGVVVRPGVPLPEGLSWGQALTWQEAGAGRWEVLGCLSPAPRSPPWGLGSHAGAGGLGGQGGPLFVPFVHVHNINILTKLQATGGLTTGPVTS